MKRIVPYIIAIIIILVFYKLFSDRLDHETVAQLEGIYNEQQAVQISLATISLEDYFNEDILPQLQILSTYGLDPVTYGGWASRFTPQSTDDSRARNYADRFPALYSFKPDGSSHVTILKPDLDIQFVDQAIKQWRPYITQAKLTDEIIITPIIATPTNQIFGVVLQKHNLLGQYVGIDIAVIDLRPVMERYIAPIRSGQFGAAWVLDQNGMVIFDHEKEIIGQNVLNLHQNYDELLAFDQQILTQESGLGEYSFTVERGGQVNRKIAAWTTAYIADVPLKIAMSSPEAEISAQLKDTEYLESGIAVGLTALLVITSVFLFYFNQRDLRKQVRQRTAQLSMEQSNLKKALEEKEFTTSALVESENRFRQLAENINEVFFVYDVPPHEMSYVSPAFSRIFELPQERAFQEPIKLLHKVHREDWPRFRSAFKSLFEYKAPVELLIRMRISNEHRWMRIRGVPLVKNSEVHRVIGTIEDITLRKAYEEHALELEIERERIQVLSRFIQDASHEFKTPLSLINTSIYLMGKHELSDPARARLGAIHAQVDKIQHLVDRLVLMSRIDACRELPLRPMDINTLIMQLPEALARQMRENDIQFKYDLEENLPEILADSIELHRAYVELIDNAIQHTYENGFISVRTQHIDNQIILEVHNTGDGIPQEEQSTIFQRFYRIDKAHTTSGMGLGLSLVKAIVELHHGTLSMNSQEGFGATFTIKLPVASTTEITLFRRPAAMPQP